MKFRIGKMNDQSDVTLPLDDDVAIYVGPNGSGKSTAISIFYLAVTAQWERLLSGYRFSSVAIETENKLITIDRGFLEHSAASRDRPTMMDRYIFRLGGAAEFNRFLHSAPSPKSDRDYAERLGVPRSELRRIRSYLSQADFDTATMQKLAEFGEAFKDRVLFLPTYRRIEQDLRKLNPELYETSVKYRDAAFQFARRKDRYHEVIEFGMQDVADLWKQETDTIREFSRTQLNALSSEYLRAVVRGLGAVQLASGITSTRVSEILNRADVASLTSEDKASLSARLSVLVKGGDLTKIDDLYLLKYFSLLTEVVRKIEAKESRFKQLAELLTEYLGPTKQSHYDNTSCEISIYDDEQNLLELSSLSSGEKQVVSIFSYLYLGEDAPVAVIIDEPELSLSVLWQQRFLVDIKNSPRFSRLIAVTHSPFVYDNELSHSVMDFASTKYQF